MDCGRLSPARLEYSNYRRLACTVRLVDHGLDYSPPCVNEPKGREEKEGEDRWREGRKERKGRVRRVKAREQSQCISQNKMRQKSLTKTQKNVKLGAQHENKHIAKPASFS